MSITTPYYRNCRQFIDGSYSNSGQSLYILDPLYAIEPEQHIRIFLLILKDFKSLSYYIEPSDKNLMCHSLRIHELLMRSCVEVESNCKAILNAHGYTEKQNRNGDLVRMNMSDYNKLEVTHHLSAYQIKVPYWKGVKGLREPFKCWSDTTRPNPAWYEAYHATRHNRHVDFEKANFENLIDAICGLLVLLSSQFYTEDFSPGSRSLGLSGYGPNDGMKAAIGDYFRIKFPDWPSSERYSFTSDEWKKMKQNGKPFQVFDYTNV